MALSILGTDRQEMAMSRTERLIDTGIFKTVVCQPAGDVDAFVESMIRDFHNQPTWEEALESVRQQAAAVLLSHGLPQEGSRVPGHKCADSVVEACSDASMAVSHVALLLRHTQLATPDQKEVLLLALDLGRCSSRVSVRPFERFVLRDKRKTEGARRGTDKMRQRSCRQAAQTLAAQIRAREPGIKAAAVYVQVAKQLDRSERTIQRYLSKTERQG